jgi:DNA-binding transcriptional regulator YdaS (Cro superfamily)
MDAIFTPEEYDSDVGEIAGAPVRIPSIISLTAGLNLRRQPRPGVASDHSRSGTTSTQTGSATANADVELIQVVSKVFISIIACPPN